MIKPKHSFKRKFNITDCFIDRKEAKALYRSKLISNNKDYNILTFYGVGGIGKSKLSKEIRRIHKIENSDYLIMYLDLNSADDRNLGAGILKLVDSCDPAIDFKCFELAYALYFRKKFPNMTYGREKEFLSEKSLIGIGLNIVGILDNGILSTTTEIVERSIRAISNRSIAQEVKDILMQFDEYSIAEMEEWLPVFLAYDLKTYLSKHDDTKILIMFDTFEALNENVIEEIHRKRNERWVQEIISNFPSCDFPNLLFIIMGRDKIEWDDEWLELIDQYQLTEFTLDYSKEYLKDSGIQEDDIINRIAKSSKGYPLLLYLCVETYASIKNRGEEPNINSFGKNYPEIIERFIYNLDKNTVEVLRLVSIPRYYDLEIFSLLIKENNVSFPLTEYMQFNKYSFVSYDKQESEYYIHNLIRDEMNFKTDKRLLQSTQNYLLRYFTQKFDSSHATKYFIEIVYYACELYDVSEFNEWIKKPIISSICPLDIMAEYQTRGEQTILLQIINLILKYFNMKEVARKIVNIYIDTIHLGGEYQYAVSICSEYLSLFSPDEVFHNNELIKMRTRKIHHSMFYMSVNQLIDEAKMLLSHIDSEAFPEVYNELLFLIGGNLGVLSGDFDTSSEWLTRSYNFAKSHNYKGYVHRTVRKQTECFLSKGRISDAYNLITQYVSDNDIIDSRYKIYMLGVLGEVYRENNELDKAFNCFHIVEKKSKENHIIGWQAHSYLGMAMVMMEHDDFNNALSYVSKAQTIYTKAGQQWGLITSSIIELLIKSKMSKIFDVNLATQLLSKAENLNYTYYANFLKYKINGENVELKLLFL